MDIRVTVDPATLKEPDDFARVARIALEACIAANRLYLRQRGAPPLYESGVVYVRQPGQEILRDIPQLLERRGGDCDQLVCWRIAELREQGENATVRILFDPSERKLRIFHVQVRRQNGDIEDPSVILGMQ